MNKITSENKLESITYGFQDTPLGEIVIAQSAKGVCWIGFMVSRTNGAYKGDGFERMEIFLKNAAFIRDDAAIAGTVGAVLTAWEEDRLRDIPLDLRGTDFQKEVWQALIDIPHGKVVSYGDVANDIGRPNAQRAVGTAVGENPISLIIPCHRVVQASGRLGNYGWGLALKSKILKLEGAIII
jgi:AraC family transcriptional regulator of adaptative response/methylated-DNA-[protein]-cysteine methyltransferase